MIALLVISSVSALIVSAICSLMEASLYAVPLSYARNLSDRGVRGAKELLALKEDIGRPMAAILILNTVANTTGAALGGATTALEFGAHSAWAFTALFTVLVLVLSELIPKQFGRAQSKRIALLCAPSITVIVRVFSPLISLADKLSSKSSRGPLASSVSGEDIVSLADMGTEEGVLDHLEGSVIRNVIGLDRKIVREVLTPRVVVFRIEETTLVGETESDIASWHFTRLPLFSSENEDRVTGYVIQRDIYRELLRGNRQLQVKELARPLKIVPELLRVDQLALQMFAEGEQICGVIDEHGAFAGVVTLEDIIEEIVGREILDEYDLVSDLRNYAKILFKRKLRTLERKHNKSSSQDKG